MNLLPPPRLQRGVLLLGIDSTRRYGATLSYTRPLSMLSPPSIVLLVLFACVVTAVVACAAFDAFGFLRQRRERFVADVPLDLGDDGYALPAPVASASPPKRSSQCPTCEWKCDESACPQECTMNCAPPQCAIKCKPLAPALCEVTCDPPTCHNVCPKDEKCLRGACAGCRSECEPPVCRVRCTSPKPHCRTECAPPTCQRVCRKPTRCPSPTCELVCEQA